MTLLWNEVAQIFYTVGVEVTVEQIELEVTEGNGIRLDSINTDGNILWHVMKYLVIIHMNIM